MKALAAIFFVIHILSIAGIVILLLLQAGKTVKVLPKGLTHLALTALVAGIVMVGAREAQHHQNATLYPTYNYGTLAAKLAVLVIFLFVAFKNAKASSITRATWVTLLGLVVVNIGLAGSLK
jgi:hypothetical protein